MSISLATLGMFNPPCVGDYVGGAIIPPETEDKKKRLMISVKSVSSHNKKPTPIKIILKCSNNLGV